MPKLEAPTGASFFCQSMQYKLSAAMHPEKLPVAGSMYTKRGEGHGISCGFN